MRFRTSPFSSLALAAALLAPAAVHAQDFPADPMAVPDPANLQGLRVQPQDPADTLPVNHGAPALFQLLLKLRTRASLMMIVAHPDDEDGGMLTLVSRGLGARTAMLTLTRGEGGQNLMTGDFDDALGLIRTQELLAADRYFGVDQFFGTEVDFGFSKTKEEAFGKWTHDRVLYDAVRAVRLYRPLVLTSVFIGGPTDGHGQHQVSGEITQEVFTAAADPRVFPEQHLPPWAPLKVYARVPFARITPQGMFDYATGKYLPPQFHNYVTGTDSNAEPTASVTLHEGLPAQVLPQPMLPAAPATYSLSNNLPATRDPNALVPVPQPRYQAPQGFASGTPIPGISAGADGQPGQTFVQFARRGLALQKTQIGENTRPAPAGAYDVGYTLYGSRLTCPDPASGTPYSNPCPIHRSPTAMSGPAPTAPGSHTPAQPSTQPQPSTPETSFFDGIDTSLPALAMLVPNAPASLRLSLIEIDRSLAQAQQAFDPEHLDRTVPPLHDALTLLDELIEQVKSYALPAEGRFNLLRELQSKRVELNDALVLARGISLDISAPSRTFSGSSIRVEVGIEQPPAYSLQNILCDASELNHRRGIPLQIPNRSSVSDASSFSLTIERKYPFPPVWPYFTRQSVEDPLYYLLDPSLDNAPQTPPSLLCVGHFRGEDALEKAVIVHHREQAVFAVPAVTLSFTEKTRVVPAITSSVQVRVQLKSEAPLLSGKVVLERFEPYRLAGVLDSKESPATTTGSTNLIFNLNTSQAMPYLRLRASFMDEEGHESNSSYRPIGYPGLPYTNLYTPATFKVVPVDVTTAPNLRVAYLPGTGDAVAEFLPGLGIRPTLLTDKDLTADRLAQFDAVLLGVRVYTRYPQLNGTGSDPLKQYAARGGVVIAQYNSAGFDPASAPYPFTLPGDSAHNVVEEDQPVRILAPDSPVLTWPNRITAADFDHWVSERGHGFASTWDPHYTPLLETHDPGQDPQRGGLLLTRAGKGAYIYCAFALYRQLPEAVPGAYRLLANLLSLGKNPAFQQQAR